MKKIVSLFSFVAFLLLFSFNVNSETSGVTSKKITVELTNVDRGDYKLDLLVPQDESQYGLLREGQHGSIKESELYLYNKDGEMAYFLRNDSVKGKITGIYDRGREKIVYEFTGAELPNKFKVIVQSNVNPKEIFVSEAIVVTNAESTIVVNFETGKVKEKDKNLLHTAKYFILILLFVVIVKFLISIPLGFKFKKTILLVNFIAQVALFFLAFYLSIALSSTLLFIFYLIFFISLSFIEFVFYRQLLDEEDEGKNLIIYILISGIITFGFAVSQLIPIF